MRNVCTDNILVMLNFLTVNIKHCNMIINMEFFSPSKNVVTIIFI